MNINPSSLKALEEVDTTVFSSDALADQESRDHIRSYAERWLREINRWEAE